MPRKPRILTRANAGVEVLNRALQGRYLIKPGEDLNPRIIGALAKAREKYPVDIYSGVFMSSHWHGYFAAETVQVLSSFVREFTRKLSIESGILYDWPGSTFPCRFHSVEVSEEPAAQIARLVYHLKHGCKEGLVASPLDWPGVNFVEALLTGKPLKGIWIDRSGYRRALQQGRAVTLEDFTEHLELPIEPLPCWRHLDHATRREHILEIIRNIEEETAAMHVERGTSPLGPEAVLHADPHFRPSRLERSPQPLFHAVCKKVRQELMEALSFILAAYDDARERLKQGDRFAAFPENTFPPRLPFVDPRGPVGRLRWEPG